MMQTDGSPAGTLPARIAPALTALAAVLSIVTVLLALAWSLGLHQRLRLSLYTEQFLVSVLGLAVAHAFLTVRSRHLPVRLALPADLALAACALMGGGWLAIHYPQIAFTAAVDPSAAIVPALALIVTLLLALLRVAGWPLTIIVLAFCAYGLWGSNLSGQFQALPISPERLAVQLSLDTGGILGMPLGVAATIVVVFVVFGRLLDHLGGATFFTDLASALMGRFRGGSAKISILSSAAFGSISGSAVSNVATTGVVTIPLMQRGGFRKDAAAGIESVASTGGQLAPPVMGAAAFLMAEFLDIPYAQVVIAALVPALLYYVAIFVLVDLTAARDGIRGVDGTERPDAWSTLIAGWPFLLPFVALVYGLFALNLQAQAAGILAAVVLLVAAPLARASRGRFGPRALVATLASSGSALSQIIIITAAAGIVIGVMNETGLGFGLTAFLTRFASDEVLLLIVMAALLSIVLGMGMPTIAVYVLLATLIAPALTRLGIDQTAAHLFVLYFGMMSMITPPIAIAAFAAASISGADPMRTAFQAMKFGWPAYVLPFAFVLNPALILRDGALAAILPVTGAVVAVLAVSAAMIGHFRRPLGLPLRVLLAVAGMAALFWPAFL
ncbi:MAG: TRAP transporter permease [Pararhodobacter sp.]